MSSLDVKEDVCNSCGRKLCGNNERLVIKNENLRIIESIRDEDDEEEKSIERSVGKFIVCGGCLRRFASLNETQIVYLHSCINCAQKVLDRFSTETERIKDEEKE